MSEAACPVMEELKRETASHHEAAEHHPFQRAFAKGRISRDQYIAYLKQMLVVHEALERQLYRAVEQRPDVARVVTDEQFQAPYLRQDLEHFGEQVESIEAGPAAAAFVESIGSVDPTSGWPTILGMHYVLEGSNNGSRFIAMGMMRGMMLQPGPGLLYLMPYGDRQPAVWATFKQRMNEVELTPEQREEMVVAAKAMFDWIGRISDDLAAVPAN